MIYMYLLYMKMIWLPKKQRSIRSTQKSPLTLHHPKTPTTSLATLPSATSKVKHRFGSCVKKTTTKSYRKKRKPWVFFGGGFSRVVSPKGLKLGETTRWMFGGCLLLQGTLPCFCCSMFGFKGNKPFVTCPGEKRNNDFQVFFIFVFFQAVTPCMLQLYGFFQDIPRCAKKLHVAARSFDRFFPYKSCLFHCFPLLSLDCC